MKDIVLSAEQARALNPIVLAFVGDAVHTLFVRKNLVKNSDAKAGQLHKLASNIVSAVNQSKLAEIAKETFTPEEQEIFLRGRNAHTHSSAKNADILDYKRASGFEAVIGYLYLTGQQARLDIILKTGDNL